jgi:hypothetical protein
VLAGAALAYCALAIAVLMRRFGPPPGVPVYMGGEGAQAGYKFLRNFGHLTDHPLGPVGALATRPLRYLLWIATDGRLTTALALATPVLLAPLFARGRIFLLAPLGIVLLSDNPEITELRYHYGAMQQPGMFAAGVYGMATWLTWAGEARRDRLRRALLAGVVAAAATLVILHPRSVMSVSYTPDLPRVTEHVHAFDRLVARVPADAPVSASSFGGPRLSNRREIWMFPYGLDRARYALVDLQRPPWPASMESRDEAILQLLRGDWGAVGWESGVVLLARGADRARNRDAARALFLRRTFEVEGTETTDFPNAVERDPGASDGYARVVRPIDRRPAGWLMFGPYVRLPAGRFRVTWRLRADPTGFEGEIGHVDVFANGHTLAFHRLAPEDFPDGNWRDVSLEFDGGRGGLEFRVHADKGWLLAADRVSLEPLSDEGAMLAEWRL